MEQAPTNESQQEHIDDHEGNGRSPLTDEIGIKILLQWDDYDVVYTPIDPEEHGFELGMLEDHGLITHDLKVTPQGWKEVLEILQERIEEAKAREGRENNNGV